MKKVEHNMESLEAEHLLYRQMEYLEHPLTDLKSLQSFQQYCAGLDRDRKRELLRDAAHNRSLDPVLENIIGKDRLRLFRNAANAALFLEEIQAENGPLGDGAKIRVVGRKFLPYRVTLWKVQGNSPFGVLELRSGEYTLKRMINHKGEEVLAIEDPRDAGIFYGIPENAWENYVIMGWIQVKKEPSSDVEGISDFYRDQIVEGVRTIRAQYDKDKRRDKSNGFL